MSETDETLTAGTLIDGARMYAAAADAVNERYPNALHVLSHLLGMSIELALKAYIRDAGCSVQDLRRLSHDLGALYDRAKECGLDHTGSRNFVLRVLGANYQTRVFAYPEEGELTIIMPWRSRQMADELVRLAFVKIKGDSALAEMAHMPGLCILSTYPHDINASAWAVRQSPSN